MYLIFFVMIFKIEAIYQQYEGASYRVVEHTNRKMRAFAGVYISLEIMFHGLAIFVPDNNEEKNISLQILGGFTLVLNVLMFVNFLTKVKKAIEITDDHSDTKHGLCYRITRFTFFAIWFLIFILDIVFITFLRPAGSVYFAN